MRALMASLCAIALAGCGGMATRPSQPPATPDTTQAKPAPRAGGYYLNDGPGDNPPANLEQIPDAVPKREALNRGTMRPYSVMGQNYTPMTSLQPYRERGVASWYGRRYHGQKTASGELYDMYAMTAAHTVLPIPSYARVTNLQTGKAVVVRINDRGPFYPDRLIDLSYTAAYKLGVLGGGRAMVEVEALLPDAGTPTVPTVATAPSPPPAPAQGVAATSRPAEPAASSAQDGVVATPLLVTEPNAVTPVVAVTAEQKGMFLQLAAFGSRDNAENYLARLRAQIDWLANALQVYVKDGLYRVHAGPYASPAEARAAADRITQTLGIKAIVLVR